MADNTNRQLSSADLLGLNIGVISGAFAQQSERVFEKGQTFLKGAEGLRVARGKTEATQALDRIADNVMKLYDAYLEKEEREEREERERIAKEERERVAKEVARKKATSTITTEPTIEASERPVQPTPIVKPEERSTFVGAGFKTLLSPFKAVGAEIGKDIAEYQQTVRKLGFEPDWLTKALGSIYASRILFGGTKLERSIGKFKKSAREERAEAAEVSRSIGSIMRGLDVLMKGEGK